MNSTGAGPAWIEQQKRTLNAQYDCGQNIYGWDGDRLTTIQNDRTRIQTIYQPGSLDRKSVV